MSRLTGVALMSLLLALAPGTAGAFDSHCGAFTETCDDKNGFEPARRRWGVSSAGQFDARAEHLHIWLETRLRSRLPASVDEPFTLRQFSVDQELKKGGGLRTIRPVRLDAIRRRDRTLVLGELAQLPDFSYTLWDWAAGNELCPPDPDQEPNECHLYAPHIGLLNSNHMVPQAQRFYEHYHGLALARAGACKELFDALPATEADRARFDPYVLACEKEALAIEAVGHHFLQDAWSMGHMWERWGGPEVSDFQGRRTLGFAVALSVGIIHGSKAIMDKVTVGGLPLGQFDDPMCAPRIDDGVHQVGYIDGTGTPGTFASFRPAAGDLFLDRFVLNPAEADFSSQRRAMLGCTVDGMRGVYGATARRHGRMDEADTAAIDQRDALGAGCWGQRATNRALSEGFGIHQGIAPFATEFAGMTAAQSIVATALTFFQPPGGLPPMTLSEDFAFRRDMALATMRVHLKGLNPLTALDTDLASGGLPAIGTLPGFPGVLPNNQYARAGGASYTDPPLPWTLADPDPALQPRKQALALAFADAHAADRCRELTAGDLGDYPAAVERARAAGADAEQIAARCEQCVQMLAPHLRFGVDGNHDTERREPLCFFVVGAQAAFVYTGEDPDDFTDLEPIDHASRLDATRTRCGCGATTTTTTTTTTTSTTTPSCGAPGVIVHERNGHVTAGAGASVPGTEDNKVDQSSSGDGCGGLAFSDGFSFSATASHPDHGQATASNSASTSATVSLAGEGVTVDFGCQTTALASRNLTNPSSFNRVGASAGGGCDITVDFELPTAMGYQLTASPAGDGIASYQLGGVVFIATGSTTGTQGPHSGTLQPGFYRFQAKAESRAAIFDGEPDQSASISVRLTVAP